MAGKLVAVLPIAAILLGGCQRDAMEPEPSPGLAPAFEAVAGGVETNVRDPIAIAAFIGCADDGNGEWVTLTGTLHSLYNVTLDGQGGAHVKTHFQPQNVWGIGETTGARYQGTGVTQDTYTAKVGSTYTYVNNFRIIGQGPGNDYVVHELTHTTVNADGTVTASVDELRVDCG